MNNDKNREERKSSPSQHDQASHSNQGRSPDAAKKSADQQHHRSDEQRRSESKPGQEQHSSGRR